MNNMKIIEGDILDITDGIICHQVNCLGVFNKGLAKQIRQKYPKVYQQYIDYHHKYGWELGDIQVVHISKTLSVCNIAGQIKCGNGLHTNYEAVRNALEGLNKIYVEDTNQDVYIPYKMGCGLAGGNWNTVSEIIEETIPDAIIVQKIN